VAHPLILPASHYPMKTTLALTAVAALAVPAFAQHATRPDFPNASRGGVKFEHFTMEAWDASNFAKPEDMAKWQDRRYGMFIHFGITAKAQRDLSWGTVSPRAPDGNRMSDGKVPTDAWTTWPKEMRLEKYDAREWVAIAKQAGFKYIVVTTKHHEGFHMWDTAFSDFKITNTPFGRDYLKELVDACHESKMPIGFYFAQREWYHPDYQPEDTTKPGIQQGPLHHKYLEYQKNVVRELCTKYGKIDIWWWDAVTWGGMFNKEMWDSENMTRMIRELQPGIVINNRASLPGDFDTPEQHLGDYQDHRPWETCIPIAGSYWCYSGQPARPFDELMRLMVGAAIGNGNLLASWGPHWDGAYDDAQKQRLFEVGDWLKINGESIYGTRGGPWKPTTWGGSTRKGNTTYIHLFTRPKGELMLPAIPGRKVISVKMLADSQPVKFRITPTGIALTIPGEAAIKGDLVAALTLDGPLDDVPAIDVNEFRSVFASDSATYGTVISRQAKVSVSSTSQWMPADGGAALVAETQPASFAFHSAAEAAPYLDIDLGKTANVTGVLIRNTDNHPERMATLRASVSLDGKTWSEIWKAESVEKIWEVPVTTFVSGVDVPGRPVRFIRLQSHPDKADHLLLKQVEVYGKE
jgi:alpha-L-fucosidase